METYASLAEALAGQADRATVVSVDSFPARREVIFSLADSLGNVREVTVHEESLDPSFADTEAIVTLSDFGVDVPITIEALVSLQQQIRTTRRRALKAVGKDFRASDFQTEIRTRRARVT